MGQIILDALKNAGMWFFQTALIKFVVFVALYLVVGALVLALQDFGIIPSNQNMMQAFSFLPSGLWYFLDYFQFTEFFPIIITAYVAKFIIRRLPIIG
ncbi:MAG TPA: DUF2523 family protein [Trinickia sp.]|uniref:DUF2523 family protein n=1 Tax=Trinickia sp. TaxID=2571163 RepID=UPI002C19C521|nr:DUF2523 family protein [Trinickia sp.]HVW49895.1 DUF2523 family protein [Trinickia sp.]